MFWKIGKIACMVVVVPAVFVAFFSLLAYDMHVSECHSYNRQLQQSHQDSFTKTRFVNNAMDTLGFPEHKFKIPEVISVPCAPSVRTLVEGKFGGFSPFDPNAAENWGNVFHQGKDLGHQVLRDVRESAGNVWAITNDYVYSGLVKGRDCLRQGLQKIERLQRPGT